MRTSALWTPSPAGWPSASCPPALRGPSSWSGTYGPDHGALYVRVFVPAS